MNLWQSVLALGALCILSAITISTNNAILSHTDNVNGNVSRVTALALAQ